MSTTSLPIVDNEADAEAVALANAARDRKALLSSAPLDGIDLDRSGDLGRNLEL